MVKKLLSSTFAAMALCAAGANADILSDCHEKFAKDFDGELECISEAVEKNLIDRNNHTHLAIAKSVPLSSDPSSVDFYNNLDVAFAKTMLLIKLEAVSSAGFKRSSKAVLDIIDNTENEEATVQRTKEEAQAKLDAKRQQGYENILDAVLNGVKSRLGIKDGEELNAEQKKQAKAMVKNAIYSERFTTTYKEGSLNDIKEAAGLVTYATLLHTDENGESELGVVAYMSDASMDLYRALEKGSKYAYEGDRANCRTAKEVISGFDRKNLLGKVGTVFYRDEACQPALLSFSTHAFKQANPALAKRLKATAKDKAAMVARDNLGQFIKSNIALEQAYTASLSDIQEVMVEALEGAIDDGMRVDKSAFASKITSTYEKHIVSQSSGDTRGMTLEKTWYDDLGNVGVVGAAVSYSLGNKEAAQAMQDLLRNAKASAKPVAAPKPAADAPKAPKRASTTYNRNSVVDDF